MSLRWTHNRSCIVSWSSRREPAMHVWPVAAKMPDTAPLTASSTMQSSNTIFGDLPPSSSETFLNVLAASSFTLAPVALPPVKATLASFGWVTSGSPTTGPYPVTTLTTPGGNPDSAITSFTNSSRDADVYSDGLMTTVEPAANAGASFHVVSISGHFHGVITPVRSRILPRGP